MGTPFRQLEDSALAKMSPGERERYEDALDDEELRLSIAKAIHDARVTAGLSQLALAERVGVSRSTISAIENGSHLPTILLLYRTARGTHSKLTIEFTHPAPETVPLGTSVNR